MLKYLIVRIRTSNIGQGWGVDKCRSAHDIRLLVVIRSEIYRSGLPQPASDTSTCLREGFPHEPNGRKQSLFHDIISVYLGNSD